jgi:RNA polymerase-binding transcription factor DksA
VEVQSTTRPSTLRATPDGHDVAARDAAREDGAVLDHDAGGYAELLRARLAEAEARRAELARTVAGLRAARGTTFDDDEHDPEGATLSLEQAREVALLASAERGVAELVAAQRRLAEGSSGVCEACGGRIPAGRMEARPEAVRCVPCLGVRPAR